MEILLNYILKSAGLTSLFLLIYLVFLRKDTTFQANRIFLLAGILTSFLLPALEITRYTVVEAPVSVVSFEQYLRESTATETPAPATINWWLYAGIIYLTGVAFFLIRLNVQLLSLSVFLKSAVKKVEGDLTYFETPGDVKPFSFFRNIVFNPNAHTADELELILKHEKAHARQWHSADVLLTGLAVSILWFNPLIWVYKKYLLQNLEFLADRATVASSGSRTAYQKALIRVTVGDLRPVLANHFYQSLIKKRIIMLNKTSTSKTGWKTGFVLPLLAGFTFLFQVNTEAQVVTNTPQTKTNTISEDDLSVTLSSRSSQETLERLAQLFRKRGIELYFETVERNDDGIITGINVSFRKSAGQQSGNYNQNNSAGIQPFKFYTKENGETGFETLEEQPKAAAASFNNDPKLLTGKEFLIVLDNEVYEMNSLRGKYIQMPKDPEILNPQEAQKRFGRTSKDGALVISEGKLIDDFDAAMRKLDARGAGTNADYLHISEELGAVLINVNKKVTKNQAEADEMFNNAVYKSTHPDSLTFIQKYKKSSLFSGVHGHAVEFDDSNASYRSALDNQKQSPLIVIDGEVQTKGPDPNKINPENIKSINVLKYESATEKYGEKGKHGVVEIIMKTEEELKTQENSTSSRNLQGTGSITIKSVNDSTSTTQAKKAKKITITGASGTGSSEDGSPLYIIDGKVMDADFDTSTIDPEDIESITVLRGDNATEKYGERAADGVIEINLKKKD